MCSIRVGPEDTTGNHPTVGTEADKLQDMELAITKFLRKLECPNNSFDPASAFDDIIMYVTNYDRILYSTISNRIYARYAEENTVDALGTLQSNLDTLVQWSGNSSTIEAKKQNLSGAQTTKSVDDARKVVLKIWDHVALASQQYVRLRQSDEEYTQKFEKRILKYEEQLTKDMNTQMLTIVGIFTALAFLIFGSISSLDGIFENLEIPVFKTMCVGLIWGICISNMIFVFLYCIGKMTSLNFKANQDEKATIFQKYPVVWWTNGALCSLLGVSIWGYYLQYHKAGELAVKFLDAHPCATLLVGGFIIFVLITIGFWGLHKITKYNHSSN